MILTKILENKSREIEDAKSSLSKDDLIKKVSSGPLERRPFSHRIKKPNRVGLIAELKKASPSAGVIREKFDPLAIATTYKAMGADAISIVTDKNFFQGDSADIAKVRSLVNLPVLRKDFIIDEYQVYESALLESDAILLIADILSPAQLKDYLELSNGLGMEALVEVHNEEDLNKALESGADIIGINNRDLHTFKVDLNTTVRMVNMIPDNKVRVSESGISKNEDILFIRSLGVDAVLIGEAFLRADDIGSKVREIVGH
ncbi:MAG: hypothetical protein AUJ75_03200 [Candidatus Omnitrophica bacterium CG1_02_49_10]|nr:MAG: hypothetical protein AUJ75_03200 [Candidatus Omnitrophica bacterium CG1_02_49_10]